MKFNFKLKFGIKRSLVVWRAFKIWRRDLNVCSFRIGVLFDIPIFIYLLYYPNLFVGRVWLFWIYIFFTLLMNFLCFMYKRGWLGFWIWSYRGVPLFVVENLNIDVPPQIFIRAIIYSMGSRFLVFMIVVAMFVLISWIIYRLG